MTDEGELWVSRTNSGDDSKGMAFGLSGDLFLPILIGIVVSIMAFTIVMMTECLPLGTGFMVSSAPSFLAVAYVMLFRHNKPPHYDIDLFENVVMASDGIQRKNPQPLSPPKEAVMLDIKAKAKAEKDSTEGVGSGRRRN